MEGNHVECEALDKDPYGRIIGRCFHNGIDKNALLVEEGLAWAFRRFSDDYVDLEERAQTARIGVWQGDAETPWDYRANRWERAAEASPRPGCPIKGNINRDGENIYHTPWSPWYGRTQIDESQGHGILVKAISPSPGITNISGERLKGLGSPRSLRQADTGRAHRNAGGSSGRGKVPGVCGLVLSIWQEQRTSWMVGPLSARTARPGSLFNGTEVGERMMSGERIKLTSADGHGFDMYVARPQGKAKGAIVVLQEIFGVNDHIRSVCDRLAESGFVAGAPALFDRIRRDYQADYEQRDVSRGIELMARFDFDRAEDDIAAAIQALKIDGKVSLLGFCLGGSLAYKMATVSSEVAAASCYYGGRISGYADEAPKCPVVLHYGLTDASIPPENIEIVRRKQPHLPVFVYPAGHGFNCDARAAFEPESAKLAWERTMSMFAQVSAG